MVFFLVAVAHILHAHIATCMCGGDGGGGGGGGGIIYAVVVMLVVSKCDGRRFARRPALVGFLSPAYHKPVTAMPVFTSDV